MTGSVVPSRSRPRVGAEASSVQPERVRPIERQLQEEGHVVPMAGLGPVLRPAQHLEGAGEQQPGDEILLLGRERTLPAIATEQRIARELLGLLLGFEVRAR